MSTFLCLILLHLHRGHFFLRHHSQEYHQEGCRREIDPKDWNKELAMEQGDERVSRLTKTVNRKRKLFIVIENLDLNSWNCFYNPSSSSAVYRFISCPRPLNYPLLDPLFSFLVYWSYSLAYRGHVKLRIDWIINVLYILFTACEPRHLSRTLNLFIILNSLISLKLSHSFQFYQFVQLPWQYLNHRSMESQKSPQPKSILPWRNLENSTKDGSTKSNIDLEISGRNPIKVKIKGWVFQITWWPFVNWSGRSIIICFKKWMRRVNRSHLAFERFVDAFIYNSYPSTSREDQIVNILVYIIK